MKVEKVLLISPPAFSSKLFEDINPLPPLGLGYIAAMLERGGINVKIVDSLIEGWHQRISVSKDIVGIGLTFQQIEDIIRSYAPDIVGISNLFSRQRKNAHQIAALAKKVDHSIITVMGGAHPTACPQMVMQDLAIDYVILGEGEQTIIDLIAFLQGRKTIEELDGIALRNDGELKIIPRTRFIEDLDLLPFPSRHLLNMEKYFGLKASHGLRKKSDFRPLLLQEDVQQSVRSVLLIKYGDIDLERDRQRTLLKR